MFCGKCGSKLNDGEKFCGKCGNAVQQEQMQYSNATSTLFVQPIVKNSNIKNKKSLVVVLCSIALAVSVVLGVVFIPDWNTDIPVGNDLQIEEQVNDDYMPSDVETYFSNDEKYVSNEDLTNISEESNKPQTEEITTKKTSSKETTINKNSGNTFNVNDLVGLSESEAKTKAKKAGLDVATYRYYHKDTPIGKVIFAEYFAHLNYVELHISTEKQKWSKWSTEKPKGWDGTGHTTDDENGFYYDNCYINGEHIDIQECSGYRTRIIYLDEYGNIDETESWSDWVEYPSEPIFPGISYNEFTGEYTETEVETIYRWRYTVYEY